MVLIPQDIYMCEKYCKQKEWRKINEKIWLSLPLSFSSLKHRPAISSKVQAVSGRSGESRLRNSHHR
jgi:hypothetical protein